MNLSEIESIISLCEKHKLTHLEIKTDELNIKMKKELTASSYTSFNENSDISSISMGQSIEQKSIKSPMVGVFYASPSPDSPRFFNVGDVVNAGDVVCIIEAMKMMNEIKSPISGKIVDILMSDKELVSFDQDLFIIEE